MEEYTPKPEVVDLPRPRKASRRNITLVKIKRKILARHVKFLRLVIVALSLGIFVLIGILGLKLLDRTGVKRYFTLAYIFAFTPKEKVASIDGRTNILLLGKGGEGADAPELTDTMILVSVSEGDASKISLISIPRDIWIANLRAKINSAYYWGNKKQEKGGLILTKSAVEEVLGVPVQYGVVVDFSGFVGVIDEIGGIEVDVERTFEDKQFPIPGRENDLCDGDPEYNCRYETIRFEKGPQIMDGETALKFVRSRHSEDLTEGTDFARAQRQQKVIAAIENKIMTKEIFLSPRKLGRLWEVGSKAVETDIPDEAMAILARQAFDSRENTASYVIPEELLLNPPISPKYDNLYVFVPRKDDWSEVHDWIKSVLP